MMTQVLIVEDDKLNMRLATHILTERGYEVTHAEHGKIALDMVSQHPPDIILMDIEMPVMNGVEAIRKFKASKKTQHIPIIAVTAKAMFGDAEFLMHLGANDYLAKPYRHEDLLDLIEKYTSIST